MKRQERPKRKKIETINRMEENIWKSNHIPDRGLLARIYKGSLMSTIKRQPYLKMGKRFQ